MRRAMGKKKLDVMEKEREVFINGQLDDEGKVVVPGCVRNGIDAVSANKIFDEMAEFAKYAFNKSHAACYAIVSYQTAYLKAYYPSEFMAAMLNSYLGNLDKVPVYIDECKALNIDILKPDINISERKFTVDNSESIKEQDNAKNKYKNIRFGLGSIKNVGITPIDIIIEERNQNGEFKSFTDFCERIADKAVNKKCIESLIKAGAFDKFNQTRSTLLESYGGIIDTIQSANKKGLDGQFSMFDLAINDEQNNANEIKYTFIEKEEFSEKELLSQEKEMLGIYLSGHPLSKLKDEIRKQTTINTRDVMAIDNQMSPDDKENLTEIELQTMYEVQNSQKFKDGQEVKFAGIITSIKKKFTKNNKIMAFVSIEDLYGTMETIVFENAYLSSKESLIEENVVLVKGRLSIREEEKTTIIANEITNFGTQKRKILNVDITDLEEPTKIKLRAAIKYFNGQMNNVLIEVQEGENILKCGSIYLTDKILELFKNIARRRKGKNKRTNWKFINIHIMANCSFCGIK